MLYDLKLGIYLWHKTSRSMGDKIDKLALSLAFVGIASVFRKKLREHLKAQRLKVLIFIQLLRIIACQWDGASSNFTPGHRNRGPPFGLAGE